MRRYFVQVVRRIAKEKTYSLLNIFGLAAGLTCFAFIALWVGDELRYDTFNQNYDRIARLTVTEKTESGISESARTGAPLAKALKNDYAEVENVVRLDRRGEIVQYDNKQTLEPDIILTDPSFFDVFSYRLTRGNVATALSDPYSIVLTESTAKKYFGQTDPIGKALTIFMYDSTSSGAQYKVTGITPDPPKNAHFTFNILGSFKTVEVAKPEVLTAAGWNDGRYYTYLLLKKETNYKTFSTKIAHFYTRYISDQLAAKPVRYLYKLQPLRDIHLRSHLDHEIAPTGTISQIYIFSTIGIFILLLAGINYTNLSTARSVGRAKEVSIKKAVGALRSQLIGQYLFESVLVAVMALLLSLIGSFLMLPLFYQITGKSLSLFSSPLLLLFLVGVSILLGILAGIYPAFILSEFQPARVLKGSFKSTNKGIVLRQSLIVSQFVITLILITSIVIIYSQMSFIKHKNLGYDKDALLFLRLNGNADVIRGYDAFKNELTANPLVGGIATSNSLIFNGLDTGEAKTVDDKGKPIEVNTSRLRVDADYLAVHGIKLVAGKNFTSYVRGENVGQRMPIILNQSAVKKFGWKNAEDAIGKPFTIDGQSGTITGIIHDFHFNTLQHAIEPLAISLRDNYFSRITIKIDPKKAAQSITLIENIWVKHFPTALFDYGFVDGLLESQYQAEERFSKIILYFSMLSLLIACLGLYGLIAYSTSQKTKEIGIRKALGATVNGIAVMLSKDFLKLVVFACFIGIPITWYLMTKWLQDFAYRVRVEWWMFAGSVLLVLFIALLTVSFQSIKAALMNPVKSLRSE